MPADKDSSRPKRQRKEPQPTKTALRVARAQVAFRTLDSLSITSTTSLSQN
jgi:hypothetical protein